MKSTSVNPMVLNTLKATSIMTLSAVVCCLSVVGEFSPVAAQELIGPGTAMDASDAAAESRELPPPVPSPLGRATVNPFAQKDTLIPAPSGDATGDLLLGDPLEDYRKTLEQHLLNKERAKLEARARFESRSRDLIPAPLPPKRLPSPNSMQTVNDNKADLELDRLRSKLDAIEMLPMPTSDSEMQASPSDRPKQQKQPSTTDRDLDDLLDPPVTKALAVPKANATTKALPTQKDFSDRTLPAPLHERKALGRPEQLGQSNDSKNANRNAVPKYRASPTLPTGPTRRDSPTPLAGETQPSKATPFKDSASDPADKKEDKDSLAAGKVVSPDEDTDWQSKQGHSVLNAPSVHDETDWSTIVDAERHRWSTPASFRHNNSGSNVNCASCGGCVDRHGVGCCDRVGVVMGVGSREKSDCQCWRCPQQAPFHLYGPGGYVGPARSAPLRDYRVRSGDQIQLTFLIKTVRTVGAYRLVVGDELLVESDADENLTRGSLLRGLEIQPDGTITLRFIGQVHAAGQTIEQLRELLNDRYEEYYPDPSIDVTPVLTGNVARQIREAISGSEGFNPQQTVQTVTPEGSIRLPRLGAIPTQGLTLGELKREINLRYESLGAGLEVEVVLEQQAPHFVYVLGEVAQPGQFEITNATTVLGGLSLAGSYVPGANLRQIVIFRRGTNWELVSTVLDLRGALFGKASRPTDEIWLQDGDVIIVPPAPIRLFDRFVTQVFTEGIYGIVPFNGFGFTLGNNN